MPREEKLLINHNKFAKYCLINSLKSIEAITGGAEEVTGSVLKKRCFRKRHKKIPVGVSF